MFFLGYKCVSRFFLFFSVQSQLRFTNHVLQREWAQSINDTVKKKIIIKEINKPEHKHNKFRIEPVKPSRKSE